MKLISVEKRPSISIDVDAAAELIVRTQKSNGEIPWSEGDKTDPWDHIESAMGLNVAGRKDQARVAFRWTAEKQLEDGSWYSSYRDGEPEDCTRDANMSSYVAVGVFHDYLINRDIEFLENMWPVVRKAVDFVLTLQARGGEIYWAVSPEGVVDPMALLTGSSSVFMSLKCALAIARRLNKDMPVWKEALRNLGDALRLRPHLFNMSKSRFSMDWFYPVLSGALTGGDAQRRIEKYWDKFVVKGQGVLCVHDQPWVTMAETSELVLALSGMGSQDLAETVFSWITEKTFDDSSYWCGHTHPDMVVWPEEKVAWTNAVVIMAADALYNLSPGGRLFNHQFWQGPEAVCLA